MMLKALPLVQFWSVLLLKEQMMASAGKTLKTLVWWAQNRSISNKICLENNTKSAIFYRLLFGEVCPENSREFVPKNPAKFDFFFRDLSEGTWLREYYYNNTLELLWVKPYFQQVSQSHFLNLPVPLQVTLHTFLHQMSLHYLQH